MSGSADRNAALVILAILVALVWDIRDTPAAAAMFPNAVLALTALLTAVMFARGVIRSRRANGAQTPFFTAPGRFCVSIVAIAIYVFAIEPLGFYTASALFIVGSALALGERRLRVVAVTTVGFLLLAYLAFGLLFERPLPREFFQAGGEIPASVRAIGPPAAVASPYHA